MTPDPDVVRLNYSSPRVFFVREYRHRSRNAAVGIVALIAFTGFFAWGARDLYRSAGPDAFATIVASMAVVTLLGAIWMMWRWWLNVSIPVKITEEGVMRGRTLWTWSHVAAFGGDHAGPKSVTITITLRGLHNEVALMTTPSLNVYEFNDLAKRLAMELAERYPHVKFLQVPEDW